MQLPLKLSSTFLWFKSSIAFFRNNFSKIITLGLIAAVGRTIQLGAFGTISSSTNLLLEIPIEASRVLIFLYTLGLKDVQAGASRLIQVFTRKIKRQVYWKTAITTLKTNWLSVLANLIVFSAVALVINKLIDYAAYQTCLLFKLKAGNLISETASE